MTTALKIEGMSCKHCVAAVLNALYSVKGVTKADVDLAGGKATVTHEDGVSSAELISAVEDQGYDAAV
ncbi:MAG: cation transporter [Oscillospiraceae bacterium]|jgi:copper chaperone CopZ|nr:cation transporter [Oscillospiraceae bacterium]